jgi:hypothetical protein
MSILIPCSVPEAGRSLPPPRAEPMLAQTNPPGNPA